MKYKHLNWKRRKGEATNITFAQFGTKAYKRVELENVIDYYSRPIKYSEGDEWKLELGERIRRVQK